MIHAQTFDEATRLLSRLGFHFSRALIANRFEGKYNGQHLDILSSGARLFNPPAIINEEWIGSDRISLPFVWQIHSVILKQLKTALVVNVAN